MNSQLLSRTMANSPVILMAVLFMLLASPASAQPLEVIEVAPGVHMLRVPALISGNIGVASGADRTMIIDTSFAALTPLIRNAIAGFAQKPVSIVLNTHYHGDHTGGNANFAQTGAVIYAHDNTRLRLEGAPVDQRERETDASLPMITFDNTMSLYVNGEHIYVFHVANAHTDGDVIVHFQNANVFQMGDIFFNFRYPYIDTDAGGTIEGIIAAVDQVLAIADDETLIIPGHGPLSDRATLVAYREMLETVRERVSIAIDEGRTLAQILSLRPTAEFDVQCGGGDVTAGDFVSMVYRSMMR